MLQKAIKITSFDVFPNGQVKPSALQRYMQQLAREDCDQSGCTYENMRAHNVVFVVTKLAIEIKKEIKTEDIIILKTYNNSIEGVTYCREYDFYKNGEEVAHATTQWVVVKYDTRTIVRPRNFPFPVKEYRLETDSIDLPRRFDGLETAVKHGNREVELSDLDENDHLNNCVYSDIALDNLPFDGKTKRVSGIKIIFHHEARIHDILSVSCTQNKTGYAVFAHNETADNPCFEAECRFSEI